jgi:hypothetical protein
MRTFDPQRVARLETHMWQAYYARANARLFRLLVATLREQYRYSYARAAHAGFHLARAAARFATMQGEYSQVLPDLVSAYRIARAWTGATFDPTAVAEAELAWWVARRTPARNDAVSVGREIAREYGALYQVPEPCVAEAGLLRAQAARERDLGGKTADWGTVERLLTESYQQLATALNNGCDRVAGGTVR